MRALLLELLDATSGEKEAYVENIQEKARVTKAATAAMLARLKDQALLTLENDVIKVNALQRTLLAVEALKSGATLESVSRRLSWREFEEVVGQILEANHYFTLRNLVIRCGKRRFQIDLIGLREPLLLCIDCKHWKRSGKAMFKAADKQLERTVALAENLKSLSGRLRVGSWKAVTLIPLLTVLYDASERIYNRIPVVSVSRMREFINKIDPYVSDFVKITVSLEAAA